MRPRSTASAQTGRSGQEGRQASMTSAEGRGPAATHSTRSRISGSCAADMTTPPDDRGEASLARKTPSPHIHPSTAGEAFAAGAALAYWRVAGAARSEEHTSELQSLMRISYAVFCLKKKKKTHRKQLTRPV